MYPKEPERLTFEKYMRQGSSFRIFRNDLQETVRLHWHEFYELAFVFEGEGFQVWNGNRYRLRPGSLFLLTPADFHEIGPEPGGRLRHYNTIFSEDLLSAELMQLLFRGGGEPAAELEGDDFALILSEFERIWTEYHEQPEGHALWIRGAMERVMLTLLRRRKASSVTAGAETAADRLRPAIRRALTYLHHHFREPLTLDDMAKQAGMSAGYFSESFRKATGLPFQTHLQGLRLRFARSLLQASDLPVTDICYASGFGTLSHFERAFKEKFGLTPSGFRKLPGGK